MSADDEYSPDDVYEPIDPKERARRSALERPLAPGTLRCFEAWGLGDCDVTLYLHNGAGDLLLAPLDDKEASALLQFLLDRGIKPAYRYPEGT